MVVSWRRWRMGCLCLGLTLLAAAASPARAELESRKGDQEVGLTVGHGFSLPFAMFKDRTDAPFVFLHPTVGRYVSARNQVILGAPLIHFYEPRDAMAAGLSATFRHHLRSKGRWIPFVEVGAGALVTDLNIPELGGDFQFMPLGGIGLRYRANDRDSLILAARWFHMSNAGLRSPNTGKDNGLLSLGYCRKF